MQFVETGTLRGNPRKINSKPILTKTPNIISMRFEHKLIAVAIAHNGLFIVTILSIIALMVSLSSITVSDESKMWVVVATVSILATHLVSVYRERMWKLNSKYGIPVTK